MLGGYTGRYVEDRTGLDGAYSYKLEYAQEGPPGAPPDPNAMGASIFSALQEQLGLKLDSIRGPVEVLAIDRLEQPSPD